MVSNFGGVQIATSIPAQGKVNTFKIGDTLFSNIRTYFKKVWQAKFSGCCSNDVLIFRSKNKEILHPDYLFNICCWDIFTEFSVRTSKGAKMPRGDKDAIMDFDLYLPPINKQILISNFLKTLDDRITLLRETNATLEAMAQALFKSWFVNFDPVHAKQQGRAPEGMDAATAALFPDGFEESELGMVPKGWKLLPFGECLSHTIGGDWGSDVSDEMNNTRVAIIRGTDIPDLQACSESRVPIRFTTQKKLKSRELKAGDIVIEVSGGSKEQPTGRSILITEEILARFDCPVEPASFCRLFRPSQTDFSYLLSQHLIFIYAQGKTWEYQNQSTGIANFQTAHFLESELVAVPTDAVLKKFCEIVAPLVQQMNSQQIGLLANLRDTLLPRLISGQLRLPQAQALLQEVGL